MTPNGTARRIVRSRIAAALIAAPSVMMIIGVLAVELWRSQGTVDRAAVPAGGDSTVSGLVFQDRNENGEVDQGDGGIAQQKVILTNTTGTRAVQQTMSGPDGSFHFERLAPGHYRITVVVVREFTRTTDNSFTLELLPGAPPRDVRFGLSPARVTR